jgi:nuclear GTP-binding protein
MVAPGTVARVEPNRRWFGNTRVISQRELEQFREAVVEARKDPYTFIMRQNKLPMSLIKEPTGNGGPVNLLATQPFEGVFGPKAQRKKPKLTIGDVDELAQVRSGKPRAFFCQRSG